jgi:uncharacterized protein YdcH (DUF465 family)
MQRKKITFSGIFSPLRTDASPFFFKTSQSETEFRAADAHGFNKFFREENNLKEQEIIEYLKKENGEFRRILEEHHGLDAALAEIDKKVYLTPEEEIERKKLQKQKLAKKDKMAELIRDFKKARPVG